MCLGGPNHCRVGQMGSQSFYGSIDCRLMLAVTCCASLCLLVVFIVVASC
jgi:hypothetical protein